MRRRRRIRRSSRHCLSTAPGRQTRARPSGFRFRQSWSRSSLARSSPTISLFPFRPDSCMPSGHLPYYQLPITVPSYEIAQCGFIQTSPSPHWICSIFCNMSTDFLKISCPFSFLRSSTKHLTSDPCPGITGRLSRFRLITESEYRSLGELLTRIVFSWNIQIAHNITTIPAHAKNINSHFFMGLAPPSLLFAAL